MTEKTLSKTLYRYCGEGLGIPGLPRDLTHAQASELGVLAEFNAAIAAGVYKPVTAATEA